MTTVVYQLKELGSKQRKIDVIELPLGCYLIKNYKRDGTIKEMFVESAGEAYEQAHLFVEPHERLHRQTNGLYQKLFKRIPKINQWT